MANTLPHTVKARRPSIFVPADHRTNEQLTRRIAWLLTVLLGVNQILIGTMLPKAAAARRSVFSSLFGVRSAAAKTIIGPQLNPDGKTTSLVEQPTISEVPANPKSGDDLADAKVVMLAHGKPEYAPGNISFDDPINAQNKWGAYETSIQLNGSQAERYDRLITAFLCSYCCGSADNVTRNKQCACAHAKAARGYFKYMIQTYGVQYSDEQLLGEGFRWQAIWYPRGAVADYLLAIGKSEALPHQPHGGAGADGLHGLGGK